MKTTRRDIREASFILIFEKLFRDDSFEDIMDLAENIDGFTVNDEVEKKFRGVYDKQSELDSIIAKYSSKRNIERIPKINVAIMRLAIYEALYDDKVPVNVAVSEAVTLARKYAMETDASFINGVLGSFARSLDHSENPVAENA